VDFLYRNRRNLIKLLLIVFPCLMLLGCNKEESEEIEDPVEVLMITDYGTINDGSFNEGTWKGILKYTEETGCISNYYVPDGTDKDSITEQIKRGVKNGAKIIICPGYLHEEAVYNAQIKYPDVKFVIIDGVPHNSDYSDSTIGENTLSIMFAEEQAGFLAGYSAVRDGHTGLGFMGGVPEDSVIRFGYGFVQGADYAAIEMGVEVHIRYSYMNTFDDIPIVEATAATWYEDDTSVIFACGGSIGKGIIRAASEHNGKVIGVDIDQSNESETVLTSAVKSIPEAVYQCLLDYKTGNFKGGVTRTFTAADNGVSLPMDTSRFERFSQSDYDSVYSRLTEGMIVPYKETNIATTQELTLVNTVVTYIVPN